MRPSARLGERPEHDLDVLVGVRRHQARSQTVATSRDRRVDDRTDENATVEEHAGQIHRLALVTYENRHDTGGRVHRVPPLRLEPSGVQILNAMQFGHAEKIHGRDICRWKSIMSAFPAR
jgi:hypothetical protein